MNRIGGIGVFLLALVLTLSSCFSTKTRNGAMLPAARNVWERVNEDFERGVIDGLEQGDLAPEIAVSVRAEARALTAALADGSWQVLDGISWDMIEPWAVRGVQAQIAAGELTELSATPVYQRILNMRDILEMLSQYASVPQDSLGKASLGY